MTASEIAQTILPHTECLYDDLVRHHAVSEVVLGGDHELVARVGQQAVDGDARGARRLHLVAVPVGRALLLVPVDGQRAGV